MIFSRYAQSLPSSTLIADLCRRTEGEKEKYCPISTKDIMATTNKYLNVAGLEYKAGYSWDVHGPNVLKEISVEDITKCLMYYDLDSELIASDCFFNVNSKLEDAVLKCYVNALSTYFNIAKSLLNRDMDYVRAQEVFTYDEDGEIKKEEAFNAINTTTDDMNAEHMRSIVQQIIYYLKLFHDGSAKKGFSILSFIIAYMKANEYEIGGDDVRDKKTLVASMIYQVDAYGTPLSTFSANHVTSRQWKERADWFYNRNIDGYKDQYNLCIDKFIALCRRVGVMLGDEPVEVFTTETVSRMTTTYIQSNIEYVEQFMARVDINVFKALSSNNVIKLCPEFDVDANSDIIDCVYEFRTQVLDVLSIDFLSDEQQWLKSWVSMHDPKESIYFLCDLEGGKYLREMMTKYKLSAPDLKRDDAELYINIIREGMSRIEKRLEVNSDVDFLRYSDGDMCWYNVNCSTSLEDSVPFFISRTDIFKCVTPMSQDVSTVPEVLIPVGYSILLAPGGSDNKQYVSLYDVNAVSSWVSARIGSTSYVAFPDEIRRFYL